MRYKQEIYSLETSNPEFRLQIARRARDVTVSGSDRVIIHVDRTRMEIHDSDGRRTLKENK